MVAIVNENEKTFYYVTDLLTNGANCNIEIDIYTKEDKPKNILQLAIINGCSKNIIKLLIEYGSKWSHNENFHLLAKYSDLETIEYIHSIYPFLNSRDEYDATPLYYACFYRNEDNPDIVQFLLDHGAEPILKDKYSNTPLGMAIKSNKLKVVQILITFIFKRYDHEENFENYVKDFF